MNRLTAALAAFAMTVAVTAVTAGTAAPANAATLRQQIVSVAQAQLADSARNVEKPAGSNCNYYTGVFRTWKSSSGCGSGDGVQFRDSDWCADFSKYVWKTAGVPYAATPETSGGVLTGWASSFKDYGTGNNTWHTRSSGYTPQAGDSLVFDWEGDGTIDHVGIVTSADGSTVRTIEGNSGDRVKANSYSRSSGSIVGYSEPVGGGSAPPTGGTDGHRIQMGDIDGDGLDDVIQMRDNGDVVAFINIGANPIYSWSHNRKVLTGITDVSQIRAGDFNGDGRDDLLQVRPNGDVVVFWNSGANPNFTWQNNALVLTGITDKQQITVGDINGDGYDDIIQVRPNGDVVAFWNNRTNPLFTWQTNALILTAIGDKLQLKPGDINNDGRDDLIQVRPNGDVVVFWNNGTNPLFTWQTNALILTAITDKAQLKTGDVNNDGRDDLIQVRPNGDVVAFWNNGTNPLFTWQTNALVLTAIDL
ncbi:FG-GAP-like repeat-containing protein [Sphaerisporangium aureirubrum]|uniref:FG-GAP-like repeat-containing protein n=1 Tax=Sphaerisporangium aureirubrum TaxID=1544736 RepID=A0ABW1NIM4_9ACTN